MYRPIVSGVGSSVPERCLTNFDLEKMVETNDEWIVTRTGISERRIAEPEQATSDLAFEAAQRALEDAKLTAEDLDLILVATITPDHPLPSVACLLQNRLGCRQIGAVDLNATCVGFLTALQMAEMYIKAGKHQHILVVGAETLSRITDWTDRSTCILFADAAGAFVISRGTEDQASKGILHSAIHAEGEHFELLYVPGGGSRHPQVNAEHKQKVVMEGNKIFKLAVNAMTKTVRETLEATGFAPSDIDWVVPHQANQRIIDMVARNLDVPEDKVISIIKHYGNSSSATIPLAFDLAVKEGKIKRGDHVLCTAFGGGLLWGSLLFQY